MAKALETVLVVDLTTQFWSALAAAVLGDFGAQVIRVDRLRPATALGGDPFHADADAPWNYRHELAHRNKLGLAIDLDSDRGGEIVRGLVAKADAVLVDEPVALLEQRRLDADNVRALKADIVYAHGSGFGPRGPDRDLPALDELAAARTGMMGILPQPCQPPVYPGHGPMYSTILLGFGVITALFHRQQTGEGQEVHTSLLAGNMYAASLDLQAYLAIGGERFLHPVSRLDAGNPMSGTLYPTQDGRWVTLTMPDTDRWWPTLAEIVGLDVADPRFDSHEKRCETNRLELLRLLDDRFRRQPVAHWRAVFTARQMSADVIEDYSYPAADEHARRNRYILELEESHCGPIQMIGFPIFMTDTPARLHRRAPLLGQHSAEVLHEILGYTEDQITALERDGVIAC